MNWSFWMVVVPTVCYLGTAVSEAHQGNPRTAIIFAGYALANVGFLWDFWSR